jgi:hypothetical protein
MRSVRLREFLLENLAGDLEYHPRRAILYLALAVVTHAELAELSNPFQRKSLPSIPNQAAQIVQDFDAGSLYLWPLLNAELVLRREGHPKTEPRESLCR